MPPIKTMASARALNAAGERPGAGSAGRGSGASKGSPSPTPGGTSTANVCPSWTTFTVLPGRAPAGQRNVAMR
eukprot:CAMPEP_0182834260 /NCGR_PEP_ID=MMETSP0006_2-20121128/20808_1 /TAXON_ID=97485 /ORGANISM="Prymnesium parvum, Strain Texoma1" /LENGTH=72 /DNA_ID=CAMNT_0024962471 /DNA_START=342 /DNA_END=556 /DNA_ORIENTATION=+